MTRSTWWFFAAAPDKVHLQLPAGYPTGFTLYRLPSVARPGDPPADRRPRGPALDPRLLAEPSWEAALPLIAILFLLRCALDPMDNAYYHVPLLLALLAFEVLCTRRQLPVVTLLTAAVLWLTFDVVEPAADPRTTSLLYLGWTAVLLVYLVSLLRPGSLRRPELGLTAPTG